MVDAAQSTGRGASRAVASCCAALAPRRRPARRARHRPRRRHGRPAGHPRASRQRRRLTAPTPPTAHSATPVLDAGSTPRGALTLPAAARALCDIDVGDTVLLVAEPATDRLYAYPAQLAARLLLAHVLSPGSTTEDRTPHPHDTYHHRGGRGATFWGSRRLDQITATDIEALHHHAASTARSRRNSRHGRHAGEHVIAAARAIYTRAAADGYLTAAAQPRPPRPETPPRPW